jgi:hypothetical protein
MAIAIGQKAAAHSSGSATSVTTTGVATSATGSTFVVLVQADATINTPTDNKGNTYTAVTTSRANSGINSRMYYCENGAGGSGHTFTFTTGFSANLSIYAVEITGGLTSGILDQQNSIVDSSSPFTVTTGATTQAAEISIAALSGNSGSSPATHAESTGYTIQAQVTTGGPDWPGCIASKVLSATGAQTPSFTESGASTGGVHCATFKESGGGGGGPTAFPWTYYAMQMAA